MRIRGISAVVYVTALLAGVGTSSAVAGDIPSLRIMRDGLVGLSDSGDIAAFKAVTGQPAATWTPSGGFQPIPIPQGRRGLNPNAISRSGRYVTGNLHSPNQSAFLYDRLSNTMLTLGDVPGGINGSAGEGVTSQGMVVGTVRDQNGPRAAKWTASTGWEIIDSNPSFRFGTATVASENGSIIGGVQNNPFRPVRWTQESGPEFLPLLVQASSSIHDISADGSTILGANNWIPVLWRNGQIEVLFTGRAETDLSIRADGRMAGGFTTSGTFLWEDGLGSRLLSDIVTDMGLNLNGFQFKDIEGISADGRTIAGTGLAADGAPVSFILTDVPTPGTCLAFFTLPILAGRRRSRGSPQS